MGMYDYLHNISKSINNQNDIAESKAIKKYKNENIALLKLEDNIKLYKNDGFDVFNPKIRHEIIEKTLKCVFKNRYNSNLAARNITEFVENYEIKADRIDIEYFYIFCNKNYEKICKKLENSNENWKKELAMQQFEHKKQIDFYKIKEKAQKETEKQQQNMLRIQQIKRQQKIELIQNITQVATKILLITMKAFCWIMLIPIFMMLTFLGAFIGGTIKLK